MPLLESITKRISHLDEPEQALARVIAYKVMDDVMTPGQKEKVLKELDDYLNLVWCSGCGMRFQREMMIGEKCINCRSEQVVREKFE